MVENKNQELQKEIIERVNKKKSEIYKKLIEEAIEDTSNELSGVFRVLIYDLVREEFLKDISVSSVLKKKVEEIYKETVDSIYNRFGVGNEIMNSVEDISDDDLPDNIEEVDLEEIDKESSDNLEEKTTSSEKEHVNKDQSLETKKTVDSHKIDKKVNINVSTNKEIEEAEKDSTTGILNASEGFSFKATTKSIMDSKISKYTEDASFDVEENKIAFKNKDVYNDLGGTRFTWAFIRNELINDDPIYLQDEATREKLINSTPKQLDDFFEASFTYLYNNFKNSPEFQKDFKNKTEPEIQSYLKEKRFFAKNLVSVALRLETENIKMPEKDMKELDREFLILFLRLVKVGRKFKEVFEMMRYVYCQTVYHYILQKNEDYKEETDKIQNYANGVSIDDVIQRIRNTDIYFVHQIYFYNL